MGGVGVLVGLDVRERAVPPAPALEGQRDERVEAEDGDGRRRQQPVTPDGPRAGEEFGVVGGRRTSERRI